MVTSKADVEQLGASHHPTAARQPPVSSKTASRPRGSAPAHQVPHHTSSNCAATLFFCPVIAAVVTGIAVFLQFIIAPADTESAQTALHSQSGTMDAMLQMLWSAGNSTLDPCKDFYQYACFNYIVVNKRSAYFNDIETLSFVLQGLSSNEAGRALFTYYRSCLLTEWSPVNVIKRAIRAILEALYVSADMTPLQMFILILKLNLAYGINTDPLIYQRFQRKQPEIVKFLTNGENPYDARNLDGAQDLFVVANEHEICALNFHSVGTQRIYSEGLKEFRAKLNVSVTFNQLGDLADIFCRVSNGDLLTVSNATILGSIVNGVSPSLWKDIVEDFTGTKLSQVILHSSIDVLKHRFALLTNRSMQPVTTALVLVHAGFVLALGNTDAGVGLSDHFGFCTSSSYDLYPLWILNHIISFAAKIEHNQVVVRVFNSLVDTIGTEVEETPEVNLTLPVRHLLKKIRLILPYHVYPVDTIIPKLGSNFFANMLQIRQHRLDLWSYRAPSGIPRRIALDDARLRCFVVLPLLVYSAAILERTMTVLPMAVLGFTMADNLWTVLLSTNWTDLRDPTVESSLCSGEVDIDSTYSTERTMKHPLRALRSTVRALSTADWHKKHIYWGQWQTSLSQIFYRLLLTFYYCAHAEYDVSSVKKEVASIISQSGDFLESFEC